MDSKSRRSECIVRIPEHVPLSLGLDKFQEDMAERKVVQISWKRFRHIVRYHTRFTREVLDGNVERRHLDSFPEELSKHLRMDGNVPTVRASEHRDTHGVTRHCDRYFREHVPQFHHL